MGTLRNISVCLVEYRLDPSLPRENVVPLAVVMGFSFNGREYFAFRERVRFFDHELALMDQLYRQLLVEQQGYIRRRFQQALAASDDQQQVLRSFSQLMRGSIAASRPVSLERKRVAGATARAQLEDLLNHIVVAFMQGARAEDLGRELEVAPPAEPNASSMMRPAPWLAGRALERWRDAAEL